MRFATKIGLSAAAAALIIGPLLGAAVFIEARAFLQERIVREQVQIAAGVMREIDNTLFKARGEVNVIAADNFLQEFLESPTVKKGLADTVEDELKERAKLTGPWDGMGVFDRNGRVVFTPTGPDSIGALADNPQARIAFEMALKGETYASDRIVRRHTGRPVIIFAAPVFGRNDSGKVVGVVVSYYVWVPIQSILDHVESTATIHLFNSKGEVIGQRSGDRMDDRSLSLPTANPAREPLPGGESGYSILSSASHGGGASLVVDLRQKSEPGGRGNGWTLMLEKPVDLMFAPIVMLAKNTGLLVFGVLLVVAALFVVLGRRFLRPLAELVEGVRQVEQGHWDHKVVARSNDEFGALAGSFNVMVSKLREAQEELVHKGKLAMLGQVASSVGHELRNPLGVMNNAVYFLQSMLDGADDSVKEYLGIIRDEIARSERIVAELMNAVNTRPPHLAAHGLAYLVAEFLHKCALPSSVTITLDIPEKLPAVRVDAIQLQQVLENLVTNAVDAMPEGGVLEFSAAETEGGKAVTLNVRDSGSGITPENMAKLFQPLFTTKARGIGLGLVVAKNLIEANSGTVEVQSAPGKGTLVTITLPTTPERDISI